MVLESDVCTYCKSIVVFKAGGGNDFDDYACKHDKESGGRYPNLARFEHAGDKLCLGQKGCKRFESSGLPISPYYSEQLAKINPLIKTVIIDENATTDSYEHAENIKKFIPENQILIKSSSVFYNKILPPSIYVELQLGGDAETGVRDITMAYPGLKKVNQIIKKEKGKVEICNIYEIKSDSFFLPDFLEDIDGIANVEFIQDHRIISQKFPH